MSALATEDNTLSTIKTPSSGFECHIGGSVGDRLSLVWKVSDVLKSVEIPKEMNFVVAPCVSNEEEEFWNMVNVYVYV